MTVLQTFQAEQTGINRSQNADVQTISIQFCQIGVHFGNQRSIVRALFIQPEYCGSFAQTGTIYRQLNPVFHRCVFGLASAPDIAGFYLMFGQYITFVVNDLYYAVGSDFKSFVMRTIFFRFLCHQADIGHGTHRGRVESTVFAAEIDNRLVNTGIAAIGNDCFGVARFAVFIPHTA